MKKILVSLLFLLGWAIPSQALQIGDQLLLEAISPEMGSAAWFSQEFTVAAGVEITIGNAFVTVDINASDLNPQIVVDFLSRAYFLPAAFNGFKFTYLSGAMAEFTDVSNNGSVTTVTAFNTDPTRISFNDDEIYLNFQNLLIEANTRIGVDVTQATAVPEPGTLVLLGAGLLGLGVLRRRKQTDLA